MHSIHKIQHSMGIQQYTHQEGRRMESCFPYTGMIIQTHGHVFQTYELTGNLSNDDEYDLQKRDGRRMAISLHGRHHHPYKTIIRRR